MRFVPALIFCFCSMLAACGSDTTAPNGEHRLCRPSMLCAVPAPPPEELRIMRRPEQPDGQLRSRLLRDFGELRTVFRVGRGSEGSWTDRSGAQHRGIRLYFVATPGAPEIGSLWVAFDHLTGETPKTQILASGLHRQNISVIVDGRDRKSAFVPYRIAVVDRTNRTGPTFVSGYGQQPYARHEFTSDYVRRDWEQTVTSSCGSGPLTAVPRAWENERNRICGF
jgi:hypothetical protein